MNDEKSPAPLTRRDLYPVLGIVYLLIAFALLGVARHEDDILTLTADYLLFGVAIVSSITFSVLGVRGRRREARERRDLAESGAAADRRGP